MNLLAFDTSTEAMSIAVQAGGRSQLFATQAVGGAQASSTLIPSIRALLEQAGLALESLDAIVFGQGPGSFTGLRTACSVAQGLAFGARLPVLPVETLMSVAEHARESEGVERVVAVLDARMDQVYWAAYEHEAGAWKRCGAIALGAPEGVEVPDGWALAGNALAIHGARLPPAARRVAAVPDARSMLRLAPALLAAGHGVDASHALPLYIRDKVAQTTEERAAARAQTP